MLPKMCSCRGCGVVWSNSKTCTMVQKGFWITSMLEINRCEQIRVSTGV